MRLSEIRNWLGIYFLLITGVMGGYLLIAGKRALPLTEDQVTACFQIIIPVLIGQLTIIFKWFGQDNPSVDDPIVNLPKWVVKIPTLLVALLLLIGTGSLVISSNLGQDWGPSYGSYKSLITFCVSLLNATTVFILARFFKAS